MPAFICTACGTQFPDSAQPPAQCRICEEERQYVPEAGQGWTTLDALAKSHVNQFRDYEPGVTGIGAGFAIGQRALLLQTSGGNILWDCVATLNDATVAAIKARGGLKAIAISHPHFYTAMGEWARAFDCPIHLHAADKDHDYVRRWSLAGNLHPLFKGFDVRGCVEADSMSGRREHLRQHDGGGTFPLSPSDVDAGQPALWIVEQF